MAVKECTTCHLILPDKHLHYCDHCQQPFCFSHLIEHDAKLQFEFKTIPEAMRKQ